MFLFYSFFVIIINKQEMSNKKNKKIKLPQIKKDIKAFLTSEEGKINKKDAAKIALGILSLGIVLAGAIKADSVSAACSHASHGNHSSHSSHANHAAY